MQGDVHSVLLVGQQVVESAAGRTLIYGTSDPIVNLGEYVLTTLMASRLGVPGTFLVYEYGSPEYAYLSIGDSEKVAPRSSNWQEKVTRWLGSAAKINGLVETVIKPTGLWERPLGKIITKMVELRPSERMLILRTDKRAYYSDSKEVRDSKLSLGDWHNIGAWVGGALIHYCLRIYDEQVRGRYVHLAPWNEKGRVYQMYSGSTARFVPTPWLGILPPNCKDKWGASFRPECFGTLLERYWNEECQRKALELVTKTIFGGRKDRKITLEAGQNGFS